MSKRLSLIIVLIAIVLGVSYYHEATTADVVRDEVRSGFAAPSRETANENADYKSEIPL
jgi:hypothetical protein